jgi:predicted TPR repeat methyltransferase
VPTGIRPGRRHLISWPLAFKIRAAARLGRGGAAATYGEQVGAVLLSSGDLIADRRAGYAKGLAEDGEPGAAAELMAQALELVPGWAAGWDLLGRWQEQAGNIVAAVLSWRRLAELDSAGMFGAALKLAAHGGGEDRQTTATGYVAALFDGYASEFDAALVERLGYAVPALLATAIAAAAPGRRFGRALDLGCGTGLMGERLRGQVEHLTGVDLSAGMLAQCARKHVYDDLVEAELTAYLADEPQAVEVVTAADVLMYCGALAPVFAGVARVLEPGGLFALSVEAHDGPEAIVLRSSLRYAHQPEAMLAALPVAGFDVVSWERAVIRMDRGAPVEGVIAVARRHD